MKLKFGHRVIAWDSNKMEAQKGRYVVFDPDDDIWGNQVVVDGRDSVVPFKNVELDPDATEFVTGDGVEMSDRIDEGWIETTYQHPDPHGFGHYDDEGDMYRFCRYPRTESLDGKTAIIEGKEYELRLKEESK